jgi:spore maturation protein CgeB
MRVLYIGQCEDGSTSKMRFEKIQLFFNCQIELINITPIINNTHKFYRSLGWRYKIGPLINRINGSILKKVKNESYDIVWVDKGVFIKPEIIRQIRYKTKKLVHFTPDPAFFFHQSSFFEKAIKYYDHCITTKSFEVSLYNLKGARNCLFLSQGFDKIIHRPIVDFEAKKYDVCFIGHYETERAELIQLLLDHGIEVVLAGIKWEDFVKRNINMKLRYFGSHVFGDDYARLISESYMGLGLLSKWIPEKHTTRTFEIPACKTCLVTESNNEIDAFFSDDECIRYTNNKDCLNQIVYMLKNLERIKQISADGYRRVVKDQRDYESQIHNICSIIFPNT